MEFVEGGRFKIKRSDHKRTNALSETDRVKLETRLDPQQCQL